MGDRPTTPTFPLSSSERWQVGVKGKGRRTREDGLRLGRCG